MASITKMHGTMNIKKLRGLLEEGKKRDENFGGSTLWIYCRLDFNVRVFVRYTSFWHALGSNVSRFFHPLYAGFIRQLSRHWARSRGIHETSISCSFGWVVADTAQSVCSSQSNSYPHHDPSCSILPPLAHIRMPRLLTCYVTHLLMHGAMWDRLCW
jgi:hypothetical protein